MRPKSADWDFTYVRGVFGISKPTDFGSVADIYDSCVSTDFDIPFWLNEARTAGRVLELGSGTGRVSIPLLQSGVDYSPEMLAALRNKVEADGFTCNMVEVDISEMSLPVRYDLIFISMNSFSEIVEKDSQRRALACIRAHLTEAGVFICTLRNPEVTIPGLDGKSSAFGPFRSIDGGTFTVNRKFYLEKGSGRLHGKQLYEFQDKSGKQVAKRELRLNYHPFSREEFEDMAHGTGFEIIELYGDYDYAKFVEEKSTSMIWKLRRTYR